MSSDPREFSDLSDYPQDGWGNIDYDYKYFPRIEPEEDIDFENEILEDE